MKLSFGKLARRSAERPLSVVVLWAAIIALSVYFIVSFLGSALTTAQEFTNDPESSRASDLLDQQFSERPKSTELIIVKSKSTTVQDPSFQQKVGEVVGQVRSLSDEVESVVSYYEVGAPDLVSPSQQAMLIPITLSGEPSEQERSVPKLLDIVHQNADETYEIRITGPAAISHNFTEVSEKDLVRGEIFGLPVALVILVIVFGAIVAALVPLVLAVISIAAAIGLTAIVGTVHDFSFFVVNMITMMGLAVGIDYSLFVVSRFREERSKGAEKLDAIERTGATASKAVLFSGITVILALAGMLIVPMNIFQGLAAGAMFVVVFAVLAALTLLPALLSLLGDKINYLRIIRVRNDAEKSGGFWDKMTRRVMKYPLASLLFSVALLVLAALPALDLRIGASGISSMPPQMEARIAYELLNEEFSVGLLSPAYVVVTGNSSDQVRNKSIADFRDSLGRDPIFSDLQFMPSESGEAVLLSFNVNAESTSDSSFKAVEKLRQEIIPSVFVDENLSALVGGEAASNYDFVQIAYDYTPYVFALVLSLSFLLLMIVFRSIVVPIKAIIMNLLSVGAAYGLLTLVSQKGVGAELLGFQQVEKIEAWLPLFLFCVLFGLSMDYHVFLLSRVREEFDKTRNNAEAVAFGVRSTASIITGAALIMVGVFAAFAAGDLVMFQQMGFGMAVAIFIDATLVRTFLVPASMRLLGERNWYLPKFLGWLPQVSIEGDRAASKETIS